MVNARERRRRERRGGSVRRRTREIVAVARPGDAPSRWFDLGIRALILLNVVAVVLETVPSLHLAAGGFFWWFETFSVAVFSVEYVARVWSCVEDPRYARPLGGRLRYAATPLALVDLLAVLPSLLPMVGVDLRLLRAVRLFRLFRILKLARYSATLRAMGRVFRRRREELVITLSAIGLLLLVASSLMYFAEHGAQPEKFSSIPAAMWWGVVTLTTLGYGDVYPITALGRLLGGVIALSGLLIVALPTAILGAGFIEEMDFSRGRDARSRCPHCGEPLQDVHREGRDVAGRDE